MAPCPCCPMPTPPSPQPASNASHLMPLHYNRIAHRDDGVRTRPCVACLCIIYMHLMTSCKAELPTCWAACQHSQGAVRASLHSHPLKGMEPELLSPEELMEPSLAFRRSPSTKTGTGAPAHAHRAVLSQAQQSSGWFSHLFKLHNERPGASAYSASELHSPPYVRLCLAPDIRLLPCLSTCLQACDVLSPSKHRLDFSCLPHSETLPLHCCWPALTPRFSTLPAVAAETS